MKTRIRLLAVIAVAVGVRALACLAADPPQGAAKDTLKRQSQPTRSFPTLARANTAGKRGMADRAFFGAPPVIVHRGIILSERNTDCLQCHAKENRIERRHKAIAPVPHAEYSQCTQCHVKANPAATPFGADNTFVGLDLPGKGSRAFPQAPPTVPHKTFMRGNCLSCHGPTGLWRVKSKHPHRSQCLQCHAPEARQDFTRPSAAK